jgi:DNA-binding LytR/AlgR family response regulator
MKCIIVDDEPLGRKAVERLIEEIPMLNLIESFSDAVSAGEFMDSNLVDLVFLDIRMPGVDGLEFAKTIGKNTLVIFTTAYPEYALESYEVDAIDYLVKPIDFERFQKAVAKAVEYHSLLSAQKDSVENITEEYMFVKAERRYFKVMFSNILFIEGLKDYVVIHTTEQKIITKMNLKTIYEQLPKKIFFRVNKSYIVNTQHISSFDNNDILISSNEIPIGTAYRDVFFEKFLGKKNNK